MLPALNLWITLKESFPLSHLQLPSSDHLVGLHSLKSWTVKQDRWIHFSQEHMSGNITCQIQATALRSEHDLPNFLPNCVTAEIVPRGGGGEVSRGL